MFKKIKQYFCKHDWSYGMEKKKSYSPNVIWTYEIEYRKCGKYEVIQDPTI